MTDPEFNVFQALKRTQTFGSINATAFSAGSEGAKDFTRLNALLTDIGTPRQHPGVPASPATGAKAHLYDEVRSDLDAIAGTAATIAKKDPGFDVTYRLGDDTQRQILTDAERVLKELENPAAVAKFLAYSIDSDFVTDLQADLSLIGEKGGQQEEHRQDSTGETARIAALIKEGRALLKSLGTSVTNKFRREPEVLAEWHTASHIKRTPRNKPEDDSPEPPAPVA